MEKRICAQWKYEIMNRALLCQLSTVDSSVILFATTNFQENLVCKVNLTKLALRRVHMPVHCSYRSTVYSTHYTIHTTHNTHTTRRKFTRRVKESENVFIIEQCKLKSSKFTLIRMQYVFVYYIFFRICIVINQ